MFTALVNCEQTSHFSSVSIVDFKQVNVSWDSIRERCFSDFLLTLNKYMSTG